MEICLCKCTYDVKACVVQLGPNILQYQPTVVLTSWAPSACSIHHTKALRTDFLSMVILRNISSNSSLCLYMWSSPCTHAVQLRNIRTYNHLWDDITWHPLTLQTVVLSWRCPQQAGSSLTGGSSGVVVSIVTRPETCATHLFSMSPGSHPAQDRRLIVGPRLRGERGSELRESRVET